MGVLLESLPEYFRYDTFPKNMFGTFTELFGTFTVRNASATSPTECSRFGSLWNVPRNVPAMFPEYSRTVLRILPEFTTRGDEYTDMGYTERVVGLGFDCKVGSLGGW